MTKTQWYLPQGLIGIEDRASHERIVYVGCIHQITPDLLRRMDGLCENPPDCLFFGGDLTGSKEFDTLKYYFYEVTNTGRGKLKLHEAAAAPRIEDVLNCETKFRRTLADEYLVLHRYCRELDSGMVPSQDLSREDVLAGIKRICKFPDYGAFSRTLPELVRQRLADSFAETSETLLPKIQRLQELGTVVHIIAGNWDQVANTAKNVGMDTVFDAAAFFNNNGVQFHETITVVETETTLHLLVPYWDFWSSTPPVFPEGGMERLQGAMADVQKAKSNGKTVIVMAHGQPVWEPHFPEQECKGYNLDVMNNLARIIDMVRPDEFIYPHQHDPLRSSDGTPLHVNIHYFIRSLGGEKIEIVQEGEPTGTSNIAVATYTPLRHFAHLNVPKQGDRRPLALSGSRLPAMVQAND